jgi:hypothetical protein
VAKAAEIAFHPGTPSEIPADHGKKHASQRVTDKLGCVATN